MKLYRYKAGFTSYAGDEGRFPALSILINLLGLLTFLLWTIHGFLRERHDVHWQIVTAFMLSVIFSYLASVYPKLIYVFFLTVFGFSIYFGILYFQIGGIAWVYQAYTLPLTIVGGIYAYKFYKSNI